jgi:hypothetical protein
MIETKDLTAAQRQKQEDEGQKALIDRIQNSQRDLTKEDAAVSINSKLTTKAHLGGHPNEPDKPEDQEALKVGRPQEKQDVEVVEVSTHESGEATDSVVVHPDAAAPAPHPARHVNDAIGTAAVVAEHRGDKDHPVIPRAPQIVGGGKKSKASKEKD